MTFELAKRLKDAGFPHVHDDACFFELTKDDVCNCVSLPELMEACGARFLQIVRYERELSAEWYATGRTDIAFSDGYTQVGPFPTPEEAVSELWLALQEK